MDWIIDDEKTGMSFNDAIIAMRLGKKVRRKTWGEDSFWELKQYTLKNSLGESLNDWVVVEKKTLSDKKQMLWNKDSPNYNPNCPNYVFYEGDIKPSLKEFIDWLESQNGLIAGTMDKAKEIFGEDLIE